MKEITSFSIYGFAIVSNFLLIYFCPTADAPVFLATYATGGLLFSLFATIFYTGLRNQRFDHFLNILFVAAMLVYFLNPDFETLLYATAAATLIFSDYSCAQSDEERLITVSRLGSALSAFLLFHSFDAALIGRTIWLTLSYFGSIKFKSYPESSNRVKLVPGKIAYSGTTCILYFGPLMLVPILNLANPKILYIAYAIVGNVLLKYQDFSIKKNISGKGHAEFLSKPLLLGFTTIFIALPSILWEPYFAVFLPAAIGIIYSDRIMKNVEWR